MTQIARGFIYSLAISLGASPAVMAALPPQYQNLKDLEVMVEYIKANENVAANLKSINLTTKTVEYGEGCLAMFQRAQIERPSGMVGPAPPLEFKTTTCPEESAE